MIVGLYDGNQSIPSSLFRRNAFLHITSVLALIFIGIELTL